MTDLEREINHLPPLARERARRELGLPIRGTMHEARSTEHRVFVYGTLLAGERNARWAADSRRTPAWTHGTIYDLHCGFPAYTREGSGVVRGELLTADDAAFRMMDRLEGYPRLYRREEIEVVTEAGGRVRAWVYIMNALPEGATPIASGDWRNR